MIHLDGKALQWHQRYVKSQGALKDLDWQTYAKAMRARFFDNEYSDPMSELVTLRQSASVEEYYEEFESLLNLLQLSDEYALSIFISNLKADISKSVRLFHPKDLTHALNLARQMEGMNYNVPRRSFPPYKPSFTNTPNTYPSPVPKSTFHSNTNHQPPLLPTPKLPTITYQNQSKPYASNTSKTPYPKPDISKTSKVPTQEEKDERRRKGLCVWCGVKYVFGHRCFRSQLYQLLVEDIDDKEGEAEEFIDCSDSMEELGQNVGDQPTISLHALIGTNDYQTMRMQGKIKNQCLIMLVDTGSTHNFIDQ